MREVVVAYQRMELAMEQLVKMAVGIPPQQVREVHLVGCSASRVVLGIRLVEGASESEQNLLRMAVQWGEPLSGDFERIVADAGRRGRDYSSALLWAPEPARREVET